ncbi:MAG TPA: UDP-glucose 4-epimerase GalE [Terriglobales bacterium]|nr:UDP-glucose 4-epimerase GalE [Terriglobales bacterium]
MNVLVTGGAGYIGSIMTESLLEQGHRVVSYDNLSHGYRDAVHPDALFVEGDVRDQELLTRTLGENRIEGVIHMAAFIEVGESVADPYKYLDNNTCRAVGLYQAMMRAGVRLLVLSSTAALYAPQSTLLSETSAVRPASPYGLSKLFLEQTAAWYASRGLRYYALRYFNAAGASARRGERHQPESHLIPLVLQAARGERAAIDIFGTDYDTTDGTCVRDYIHVRDLADAHVLALEALQREAAAPGSAPFIPDVSERAFNLGNGRGFSVREVIAAAEAVCGRTIPVREQPRRPGDVDRLVASSAKMRALGWQPRFPDLGDIVRSAWDLLARG